MINNCLFFQKIKELIAYFPLVKFGGIFTNEMEWLDEFSQNLINMLKEANMTQRDLADASGLSEGTISKYIRGMAMPGVKAIINIAYALDCNTDELIDFGSTIS